MIKHGRYEVYIRKCVCPPFKAMYEGLDGGGGGLEFSNQ